MFAAEGARTGPADLRTGKASQLSMFFACLGTASTWFKGDNSCVCASYTCLFDPRTGSAEIWMMIARRVES